MDKELENLPIVMKAEDYLALIMRKEMKTMDGNSNNRDKYEIQKLKEMEFILEGIGPVKASHLDHNKDYEAYALTLVNPLKISLPFLPELTIDVEGLQFDKAARVQAYLFRNPLEISFTLKSDSEQRTFPVTTIGLPRLENEIHYLLFLQYPVEIGNNIYSHQILIDANGNLISYEPIPSCIE